MTVEGLDDLGRHTQSGGFDEAVKRLQKSFYNGFIDTTSLTVNDTQCNITIECRDKAKTWIENKDISCGIYSEHSEYFGVNDWHYKLSKDNPPIKLPRPWSHEEVLRDVCYALGLRDIVPYVYIEAVDQGNGFYDYVRHINYEAEYKITIDPKWESNIVCNFVEENALDVLSKLAQSIFHEVFFDAQGKLVVRPVKTAADDAVFYFKEERDIIELSQNTNDDDVANIITVVGQTADETAVIYPFCAVAYSDTITLEKGQDEYGYQLKYPKVVATENIETLTRPSLYAPTIAPNAEPVTDYHDNPENNPSYDFMVHFPNFAQPYEKQIVLEASCPIITDEAEMADTTNLRTWNFYGALDTAVAYEKQPIMLKDRFDKDILVVCKERSMDDDKIKWCGGTLYDPQNPDSQVDEDSTPVNIPTEFTHQRAVTGANGKMSYLEEEGSAGGTPVYGGLPVPVGIARDLTPLFAWTMTGYMDYQNPDASGSNTLPSAASAYIPKGLTASDFVGKGASIVQFTASQGNSPYPAIPNSVFDQGVLSTQASYCAIVVVEQDVEYHNYSGGYRAVPAPGVLDVLSYKTSPSPVVQPFTFDLSSFYSNCVPMTIDGVRNIQLLAPTYTPYSSLPATATDLGVGGTVTIRYPLLFASYGSLSSGKSGFTLRLIDESWEKTFLLGLMTAGMTMEVYTSKIDRKYMSISDPDANCIYWKWFGTFEREGTKSSIVPPKEKQESGSGSQGKDAENNERVLIKKETFYKLAADPHTVVIECTTAGVDHHSWAEVVKFDEYQLIVKGHNVYGSMREEYATVMQQIEDALHSIGYILLGIAVIYFVLAWLPGPMGGAVDARGLACLVLVTAMEALTALALIFTDIDTNVGQNVSKVMEDLTGRVTACRRPEIELYEAGWCQAAQWVKRIQDTSKPNGVPASDFQSMRYSFASGGAMFGYDEGVSVDPIYTDAFRTKQDSMSRNHCWVYLLDLTKPGSNGISFPGGAMLTSIGWETPEIGDRNPIQYYTGVDYHDDTDAPGYTYPTATSRKVIKTRYAIEAFRDDPNDSSYTAERLLALRFENRSGVRPKANETWWNSQGYEILVDRSMTEVAVTDAGIWHDFWEKRDDYSDRRYKYVALVVYAWNVQTVAANGVPSAYTNNVRGPATEAIFCDKRWGLFVPRGLNRGWYDKFRVLDSSLPVAQQKNESNYLATQVIYQGQELLIANLYNNFKYSTVQAQIRVWGKPYGTYAPTIVYYKELDTLSMHTYGNRQIEIQNNCINDFRTARRMANMLTAQSNETFSMQATGKPYLYEGEVVMVKEENTGAIAGVFRDWENYWKDPQQKPCTQVANKLAKTLLPGIYFPQCATPTYGNNTLIACSNGSKNAYLVEIDKACNPIWYCMCSTTSRPVFILRYEGPGGQTNALQTTYTIVGMADGTVLKIDYNIAQVVGTQTLPSLPYAACMDEEQVIMFVSTGSKIYAFDLETFTIKFTFNGGSVALACANWKAYDEHSEDGEYRELGVIFLMGNGGTNPAIVCRQIYSDRNRTNIGPILASYTAAYNRFGVDMPTAGGSLEFDKHTGELIYVHRASSTSPASIWGLHVEVDLDPSNPQQGITAEFDELRWKIDYMEDVELTQTIPNANARRLYINDFFQPRHAVYDINKSLLICDSVHNRVYRLNPSGKFYVTEVTDQFDISDDAATYKQSYELVTVTAAGSLQLTNFGRNFMNTKTQEEITAAVSTTMGRIVEVRPRDKYMVKLLSSGTLVEAINNSGVDLRVKDTVIIMMGLGGDKSGVGTIIAKKALNDWTVETGKPYTYVDATTTSLEITKYGIAASETSSGGGSNSNADLSTYNARIRTIETRLRTLASIHGINW